MKIKEREIVVETEKMVFGGQALARHDRFVVFVDGALPDETVRAYLYKRKKNFAFGRVVEVIQASPERVESDCPRVGDCGGCSFRFCRYDAQLTFKKQILAESLYGVPGIDPDTLSLHPSPETLFYRNKMVFTFGATKEGDLRLGLHRKGSFMHIVQADCCMLESPESQEILKRVLALAIELGVPAFHEKYKTPGLRNVIIREGKNTGERLVEVTATDAYPAFSERLLPALDELATTLIFSEDRHVHGPPRPGERTLLKGTGFITETINGLRFQIGPDTFFQSNTHQAERLFHRVLDFATANGTPKTALDLFSGTGPIAMQLSTVADRVYGVENWAPSVEAAKLNLELNGITNVEMIEADVTRGAPANIPLPVDVVVVDPPRPGLEGEAIDWVCACAPKSIVYVSCNPTTLARDLKCFAERGYHVADIDAFDMFPHTFHMETIVRLTRDSPVHHTPPDGLNAEGA